jgi:diguanylate cyclase (GGDEF)-like protein
MLRWVRAPNIIRSVKQQLLLHYLPPVLLLVGTCFGCIIGVVFMTTQAQDRLQLARERQSLEIALQNASAMVSHDLQDYARWDEAVRHISQRLEREWLEDNVLAYLRGAQGYSVLVLDPGNRLIFAEGGKAGSGQSLLVPSADFQRAIGEVRTLPPDGEPIIRGFAHDRGRLYVYSVAQIVPLTNKVRLDPGPTYLLAIAQQVDAAFLKELVATQQLRGVRTAFRPSGAASEVAVPGSDGRPQAWITWQPARPGTALRQEILPLFLFVGLLTLLAAGLIMRCGARTVEALRQSEADARHQALHDAVTGLPNRRALTQQIGEVLTGQSSLTFLSMDLDGFKDVNDLYGHAAGDVILRQVQERIRNALPGAFVARTGGDEFGALFHTADHRLAESAAEAILTNFSHPFSIGTSKVELGVSIGSAEAGNGELSENEILRRADTAMYVAKGEGKRCYRHFEPQMDQLHRLRLSMEEDLRGAIAAGDIQILYQPVVDASTGRICSVEALSRWSHPVHGVVSPDTFIPLAETGGMINTLGRHVLRTACREALPLPYTLCVNLSPAQFWDRTLVAEIQSILADIGFPAQRLEVEITESYLLRQPEAAAEILHRLRALGVKVALDDFGTGFASIGYLRQLPLDRLKIDKAFIAPLANGGCGLDMVSAIAGLAMSLGLEITAEGVETPEQARLARLAGCSQLQGWHFGRPMAFDDLLGLHGAGPTIDSEAA